jgi:hypothetical protein
VAQTAPRFVWLTRLGTSAHGWICECRASSFLVNEKQVARYNEGRSNNSLDASGTSGLVIDNLSVTQSFAAASTPRSVLAYF